MFPVTGYTIHVITDLNSASVAHLKHVLEPFLQPSGVSSLAWPIPEYCVELVV